MTDIIATLGPASATQETLAQIVAEGASVIRLNFAWLPEREVALRYIEVVRAAARAAGREVPLLADLPGRRKQEAHGHTFDPHAPVLTAQDEAAIALCAAEGVERIALSFVRDAAEVARCAERIRTLGSSAQLIAKIERPEAVEDIERIAAEADAVMVARGDLGDTLPFETLPFVQQRLLRACAAQETPAIVATQMLASMVERTEPTRAEVTDVAVAVSQGAAGVMLSEETASGKYPVEAVRAMRRIVERAHQELEAGALALL